MFLMCVYSSGLLSGGSRGGILSRKCFHCWSAANAGNGPRNPNFCLGLNAICWKKHVMSETITQIDIVLSMTWTKLTFSKVCTLSVLLADARRGGLLCVCASDAGVSSEGTVQAQHGWAGSLHLPVWVSAPGNEGGERLSMRAAVSFLSTRGWRFLCFDGEVHVSLCRFKFALKCIFLRSNFPSWTSIFDLRVFTHPCTPLPGSSLFSSPSSRCLLPRASLIFSCMR